MAIELYNGVKLPDIPADIQAQYPYITISWVGPEANRESGYVLKASNSPQICYSQILNYELDEGTIDLSGCVIAFTEGTIYTTRYLTAETNNEWIEIEFDDDVTNLTNLEGGAIFISLSAGDESESLGSLMYSNHDIYCYSYDYSTNILTSLNNIYNYERTDLFNYNGIMLPAISEELLAQSPYAFLLKLSQGNDDIFGHEYALILSSDKFLYFPPESTGDYPTINSPITCTAYAHLPSMSWALNGEMDEPIPIIVQQEAKFEVIWSNHDIKVADFNEDGSLLITDKIYDYTSVNKMENYNGVTLPSIPTSKYPYATIIKMSGTISVNFSDSKFLYYEEDNSIVIQAPIKATVYEYYEGHWQYRDNVDVTDTETIPADVVTIIWSNYDIMYSEKDSSGNYIATDEVYDYIINFVDYNGVLLPEIPQSSHDNYTNAVIFDATQYQGVAGYILALCEASVVGIPASYSGEPFDIVGTMGNVLMYAYTDSFANWQLIGVDNGSEVPINYPEMLITVLWSQNDIMVGGIYDNIFFETDDVYFPLRSEDTLPDVEYGSEYYAVPTRLLSSIAKQTRRITGNYTRMTADKIEEVLTDFGSYKKVFYKSIEEIDFTLPAVLPPYIFFSCIKLKEVLSDKVKLVDEYAFGYCSSLTKVELPSATQVNWGVFSDCINLVEVNLPNATDIRDSCFYRCEKLKTINIKKAESINYYAFSGCASITNIDLPSVTNMYGYYTFNDCVELKSLILRNEEKVELYSYNNNMFTNTPIENGTGYIYVPAALVDTYKADTNWSNYASQFRALEDYTVDGTITGELDENKI